jgi:four helix bundle protein
MRPHFRFEDLEIWQSARDLAVKFHRLAERLEGKRLYRYAEQLRGAGLSLSNNIAEGSGSTHDREFIQFLNIARRSLFEDASKAWPGRSHRSGRITAGLRHSKSQDHELFANTSLLAHHLLTLCS